MCTLTNFQERFLVQPSDKTDPTEWIIGLTYTTEDGKDFNDVLPRTWLKGPGMVLTNQTDTGWYIFNIQSIGTIFVLLFYVSIIKFRTFFRIFQGKLRDRQLERSDQPAQ